jgi:hypothetical protein
MWKIRTLFCPITLLSGSDAENPNFVRLYHSFCLVRILKIRTGAVSSGSIIVASDFENPNWATEPEKFIALIWFLCGKSQLSPRNFVRFDYRFFGWKKFEISPIRFVQRSRSAKPYPAKFLSAQRFHAGLFPCCAIPRFRPVYDEAGCSFLPRKSKLYIPCDSKYPLIEISMLSSTWKAGTTRTLI